MAYEGFEAYDVCQVSDDNGKTWQDYATIRNHSDAVYSLRLANGESFGGHRRALYRIVGGCQRVKVAPRAHRLTDNEIAIIKNKSLDAVEQLYRSGLISDLALHVHSFLWRNCAFRLSSELIAFEDDDVHKAYREGGFDRALSVALTKAVALLS